MADEFPGSGRPTQHNGGVHRGLTCVLISCSVVMAGVVAPASAAHSATIARHSFRGAMPRHAGATRAAATTDAAPSPFVEYLGGKVLQHVKVYGVVWGTSGTFPTVVTNASAPNMADFFSRITNSRYVDWLGEYSTGSQFVGRGTFAGMYTITPCPHRMTTPRSTTSTTSNPSSSHRSRPAIFHSRARTRSTSRCSVAAKSSRVTARARIPTSARSTAPRPTSSRASLCRTSRLRVRRRLRELAGERQFHRGCGARARRVDHRSRRRARDAGLVRLGQRRDLRHL